MVIPTRVLIVKMMKPRDVINYMTISAAIDFVNEIFILFTLQIYYRKLLAYNEFVPFYYRKRSA